MRNFLLLMALLTTGMFAGAQQMAYRDNKPFTTLIERPMVTHHANQTAPPAHHQHSSSRALSSILHSERIGSAGNLLSIIESTCNQIDVFDSLNLVTFIHRNDPFLLPGSNVAQYRFDVSKNRGTSWTNDIGPITNDPSIDNVSVNGRFPQAVIFNPNGNTIPDSAYLVYSGTWHDNNTWCGQMRGRGKISGDTSTFNVHIDDINNKQVAIAGGMCKGAPGVFWNVNADYSGTFTGSTAITSGLIVEKGVWNTTTKDVDWTSVTLPQTFVAYDNQGTTQTAATSFNIAFDPTGQKGWISVLGDISANDLDSVYDPIFWKTTDGGANWTGPIWVDLDSIQGVRSSLPTLLLNGDPATRNPTTTFDGDLSVDVNGNPHLLTTVANGSEYSIQAVNNVWDITFDANAIQGCNWKGIKLADINTFRGSLTNDAQPITMDNRPLISRSADGSKLFFFWAETDIVFYHSANNDIPNLFGRAIDVVQGKITDLYNFTEGDSLWGGETSNTGGGVFGGAIFPTVGQTCIKNGNNYNIPLVLTQIDYNHDPALGLGSSDQPAGFWYINNINIPESDFTQPLDQVAPSITLNGPDSVVLLLNTPYTEDSATAFDCTDGVIQPIIQNSPDVAHVGVYNVLYIATDAAGNSDTVVRTVIVGATPVADFTWSFPANACKAQFQDLSQNLPDHWSWNFGDQSGSATKNPLKTYASNGVYHVCLTASNSFGSSTSVCKDVTVTGCVSGIDELDLTSQISMFPNPSNGKVSITVDANIAPELTVSVYNVLGETVVNPVKYKAGITNMQLDLSSQPSGLYLVKIQSDNATAVKHLTITHK